MSRSPGFLLRAGYLKRPAKPFCAALYLFVQEGVYVQSPPKQWMVDTRGFEKYKKDWRRLRGLVQDSTGKRYFSAKLPKSEIPSWAK